MAQKVTWSSFASRDLEQIVQYLVKDSSPYAEAFLSEVHEAALRLVPFPRRGRRVSELKPIDVREVFVANYRLIYDVRGDEVIIVALIHGARDLWIAWGSR